MILSRTSAICPVAPARHVSTVSTIRLPSAPVRGKRLATARGVAATALLAALLLFAAPIAAQIVPRAERAGGVSLGTPDVRPLAGALDADGRLRTDVDGAFDPAGFDLVLGEDGAPRFRPTASVATSVLAGGGAPTLWREGFYLGPGVGNGTVYVVVADGDDVFVGGLFENVGGAPDADYIARYSRSQARWYALGNGLDGVVLAIAVDGDDVYVGGLFHREKNGPNMTYVGHYDRTTDTWHALGAGVTIPAMTGLPEGIQVVRLINGKLWVGGYFVNAGGIPEADVLAVWDTASETWSSLGQIYTIDPNGETEVHGIEPYGDGVYVHCYCAFGGGLRRHGIYDSAGWTGLPVISGAATAQYAMGAVDGDEIVLVRRSGFEGLAGVPDGTDIVRYDGTGYMAFPGQLPERSSPTIVRIIDGEVVVGLGTLGGASHPFVMRHDGFGWVEVGPRLDSYGVYAVIEIDGQLWVGGSIHYNVEGGETLLNGLARLDGADWQAIGSIGNGLGGDPSVSRVMAIAVWQGELYVGGAFLDASGNPLADNVARWTGSAWEAVGSGLNRQVSVLLPAGDRLYAGGNFFDVGGDADARTIAQFDDTAWSGLGPAFGGGDLLAMAVIGDDLYVGGGFYEAADVSYATNIARWDGTAWHALIEPGNGDNPSGEVRALLVEPDGTLLVGGNYSGLYGYSNLARWDPNAETWGPIGDGAAEPNADVNALAHGPYGLVYVGGAFSDLGGPDGDGIARWDGAAWQTVGGGLEGHPDFAGVPTPPEVRALYLDQGDLYVGGNFLAAGSVAGTVNLARWDDAAWHALSSGLDNRVIALGSHESLLWVGGYFDATSDDAVVTVHVGAFEVRSDLIFANGFD